MTNILFIPLDNRPVNLLYPKQLAKLANCSLITPPEKYLGGYRTPANVEKILDWLEDSISKTTSNNNGIKPSGFYNPPIPPFNKGGIKRGLSANFVIVSLDMIAWGGLIHSRTPKTTLKEAKKRLNRFKKIIMRRKNKKDMDSCFRRNDRGESRNDRRGSGNDIEFRIYAGNIITRLSRSVFDDKSYKEWKDIYEYFDIPSPTPSPQRGEGNIKNSSPQRGEDKVRGIKQHLEIRKRNHLINLESLNLVKDGTIDFLLFSQEDAPAQGPHKIEQKIIQNELNKNNLNNFSSIQTGGDEASMVLLSRLILKEITKSEIKIYPHFIFENSHRAKKKLHSHFSGVSTVIPLFEDRPIGESVKLQIKSSGATEVNNISDADYVLLIGILPEGQIDVLEKELEDWKLGRLEVGKLKSSKNKIIAIADLIYANGGCIELVEEVFKLINPPIHPPLLRGEKGEIEILSYSGWNTANNGLGSVIATSNIIIASKKIPPYPPLSKGGEGGFKYLLLRLIEDIGYQAEVRKEINKIVVEKYNGSIFKLGKIKKEIEKEIQQRLIKWTENNLKEILHPFNPPFTKGGYRGITYLNNLKIFLPWDRTFEIGIEEIKNG